MRLFSAISVFVCVLCGAAVMYAQKPQTTASQSKLGDAATKKCFSLALGKITSNPKPDYPEVARQQLIGGTVEVAVKIDEKGNVYEIEGVSGAKELQPAAIAAALKARFSPTICDNVPARISGVLAYNFIPNPLNASYFTASRIEDFSDIDKRSKYYFPLLDLTENYGLAFGYADKKFHPDTPFTRGEFFHALRLTIDLLVKRAEDSGKVVMPETVFRSSNRRGVLQIEKISDFDPRAPYGESAKILLEKYNILLLRDGEFQPARPVTQNELIDIWNEIFGQEAVPIYFERTQTEERLITRGEFALFLDESMRVLSYKILP